MRAPTMGLVFMVLASFAGSLAGTGEARANELRIVGDPIAIYSRYDSGVPYFIAYVRVSRPVPRKSGGMLLGAVRINGLGVSETPSESTYSSFGFGSIARRGARYCYTQSFAVFGYNEYPESLKKPRHGQRVKVEVLVAGHHPLTRRVTLRRKEHLDERDAAARMGCLGRHS